MFSHHRLFLLWITCLTLSACALDRTMIAAYPAPGANLSPSGRTAVSIVTDDFALRHELETDAVKRWERAFDQPAIAETSLIPPDSDWNERRKLNRLRQEGSIDRYLIGRLTDRRSEQRLGYYTDREPMYDPFYYPRYGRYGYRYPYSWYERRIPYTYTVQRHTYSFDLKDARTGKVLWHAVVSAEGTDAEKMGKAALKRAIQSLDSSLKD